MKPEVLIIGAGAAGLMAARELAKTGKKVLILESRDRIGGRIMPLDEADFGYPAQGGAEWVHGEASVTKVLIKEAGLTLVPEDGEVWSTRDGKLSSHKSFVQGNEVLKEKLLQLEEDISLFDFLDKNFKGQEYADLTNSIIKIAEGYDAADTKLISTFTLRDEWLIDPESHNCRIKEGYTALLKFLEDECKKYGVEIMLNSFVKNISIDGKTVTIRTDARDFSAQRVLVTVPISLLENIEFNPKINDKLQAASRIGFGNVIKIVVKFKNRWWEHALAQDLSKMAFLLTNEKFLTWWTQYPEINSVLTGWMAGPEALNYKNASSEELLDLAFASLSTVFKIDIADLKKEVILYKVMNWSADPFTKGAYSYTTIHTKDAYEKLAQPIDDKVFFAGEALFSGDVTATVEGALASGLETAQKILNIKG